MKGELNPNLTKREQQVLDLLCSDGYTDKEIGHLLDISRETAKHHVRNAMEKLGFGTRMEMVVRTLHKRYEAK